MTEAIYMSKASTGRVSSTYKDMRLFNWVFRVKSGDIKLTFLQEINPMFGQD